MDGFGMPAAQLRSFWVVLVVRNSWLTSTCGRSWPNAASDPDPEYVLLVIDYSAESIKKLRPRGDQRSTCEVVLAVGRIERLSG